MYISVLAVRVYHALIPFLSLSLDLGETSMSEAGHHVYITCIESNFMGSALS